MKRYLPYVLMVAAALFAWQSWRANAFERRAQAAEHFAESQRHRIDSLYNEALWLETAARRIDTVVVRQRAAVAHVDSILPPPDTCRPNLAVRDALIASLSQEVDTLRIANLSWRAAFTAVSAVRDSLAAALASRPKFAPRLRGPSIGPAVWITPGEVRVGISLQFAGLGL